MLPEVPGREEGVADRGCPNWDDVPSTSGGAMGLENQEGLLMDINAHNQNVQENGSKNRGTLEVIPNQFLSFRGFTFDHRDDHIQIIYLFRGFTCDHRDDYMIIYLFRVFTCDHRHDHMILLIY